MKRTGLFTKIFIYTFSIFSVLVICLHLAIYFLFPSTYLSHRQETIGQKATAIAQSLEGKDRQSIEKVYINIFVNKPVRFIFAPIYNQHCAQ
ncbi:signal transduction histidine kinase [Streptococcus pneumoniae]|nr:signal transduction histidine kinase [Streptococcus pneumoniae]